MSVHTSSATASSSVATAAIPNNLGSRLRRCRENAGLAREHAAIHIGRAAGAVRDYELNQRTPRYVTLVQLANLYGVPITELTGEPSR
jgi:transcriptional regulator with XRE-family HTH domain